MKAVLAAFLGLVMAFVGIGAFELPLRRQKAALEARLQEQQGKLRPLLPVRIQIEDYQRRKALIEQQIDWIEKAREKTCPLPFASLDLAAVSSVRVDELSLDRSRLVILGRVDAGPSLEAFAARVRALPFARDVEAGAAPAADSPFGLFATVAIPPCHVGQNVDRVVPR